MDKHTYDKLYLIYSRPQTYVLWAFHLCFMMLYQRYNNISNLQEYCTIFGMDYYLWMIIIPLITATHRVGLFRTSYFSISRCACIKAYIKTDIKVLTVSTAFQVATGILIPLCSARVLIPNIWFSSIAGLKETILFVFIRYTLLSLLIQMIIYILYFESETLQKSSYALPALPFIAFFMSSIPMMLLPNNRFVSEVFNYSAGGIVYDDYTSGGMIVSVNIYLFLQVLLINMLIYSMRGHMEFFEYENKTS